MSSEKRTYQKKWFKWTAVILSVLVILAVSVRLTLKSDWLFDKAKEIVVEQVNSQINGSLSIDAIRGDLVHGFTISGINLKDNRQQDVALIDSVQVGYRLLSLISSPYTVNEILLFGGKLYAEQLEDSTWNVLNLVKEPEFEDDEPSEVRWGVNRFQIAGFDISVQSEQLLPDEYLHIDDLQANLSAGAGSAGLYGTLRELSFQVREGRLPEPIDVYLAGRGDESRVTLESLVINTGRTALQSSARIEEDGEIEQLLNISPLSWQDLAQYADELPLRQDLSISLSAEGTLDNLSLSLEASATGLSRFFTSLTIDVGDPVVLKRLEVSADGLDIPLLTGLGNVPKVNSFSLTGAGVLPINQPEESEWNGAFSLSGLEIDTYRVDDIDTEYAFTSGNADLKGTIQHLQEQISFAASVQRLLGNDPEWTAEITSDNTNLATWLNDDELDSDLNISVTADGQSFDPEIFSSNVLFEVNGNRFGDQPFSMVRFSGRLTGEDITGSLMGRLDRGSVEAEFFANNWMDDPAYNFEVLLNAFDLAEITGNEAFPTYINGSLSGEGSSADLENLHLLATVSLDSSIVNGEEIDAFRADLKIENQFITIDNGLLQSPIADAGFSVYQHITDFTNRDNRLNFDVSVKNLYSIAPLLGFERLEVQGTISGQLARNETDVLEFNGNADFENIVVDTLFMADKLTADVKAFLFEEPEIDLTLHISSPVVMDTAVQDVEFHTYTTIKENETSGDLSLFLSNDNQSSISHKGSFRVDSTMVLLNTSSLEFKTQLRNLSLENPFDITYSNDVLRVDTLTIRTEDNDAYLTLWVPHVDSLRQHAGLNAGNLNLGELQETILNESFFRGFLSGSVEVIHSADELTIKAVGLLNDFEYEEGRMDSLRFDASVADEWLNAELGSWHNGGELLQGTVQVPFIAGDPLTFDEEFFEREIEGSLRLNETDITYWLAFLPDGGPEQTAGKISINSSLSGIAGNPELSGNITIQDGLFSGISVDTVGVDIHYLHDDEEISFNGKVVKDRIPILDFTANLPFLVDLRRADILLPADDDSVQVNISTNNFDLALFNSYVDPDVIRQISGRLEGEISLTGIIENLEPRGRLVLTGGSMRVIPAGITLTEMASNILFEPDRIEVQQFTMRSGPGRLRATGTVGIESLIPTEMNINIIANQFRAVNTPEYNMLANATANLTGTAEEPMLRGDIMFLSGLVNLQNFGDRAVEAVVLEDEEEPEPLEFYDSLAMEMNVNFGRNFLIRNRQYLDMEFVLGGELDLVKQKGDELQMFGTLEGLRGFVRPLGKNFELDEAIVAFYGPVDDPQLNITTRYSPPQAAGVNIFYIIDGTLQEPDFRFDSEPTLELQDIISYTLFGKPFYELESWEQVVAGSGSSPTAADFALEVLLDRVEMLASQRLGIDVVQIDNTRSGSNNTTSIKTGWYLNEKTFFAILNEVGSSRPKTLFMLEYLLRENLELIITQGDDSREGVDLRWKLDY